MKAEPKTFRLSKLRWGLLGIVLLGLCIGTLASWIDVESGGSNARRAQDSRRQADGSRVGNTIAGSSPSSRAVEGEAPSAPVPTNAQRVVIGQVGVLDSYEYHDRDPGEFQGRRIPKLGPTCDATETCGMASACISGTCGPCTTDAECAGGEVCVLQNCLLSANVSCRSRRDCEEHEHCIFSEPRPRDAINTRGNVDLRSFCNDLRVGLEQRAEDLEVPSYPQSGVFHGSDLDHTTKMLRNLGAE